MRSAVVDRNRVVVLITGHRTLLEVGERRDAGSLIEPILRMKIWRRQIRQALKDEHPRNDDREDRALRKASWRHKQGHASIINY